MVLKHRYTSAWYTSIASEFTHTAVISLEAHQAALNTDGNKSGSTIGSAETAGRRNTFVI
jgi:hypothetical protein